MGEKKLIATLNNIPIYTEPVIRIYFDTRYVGLLFVDDEDHVIDQKTMNEYAVILNSYRNPKINVLCCNSKSCKNNSEKRCYGCRISDDKQFICKLSGTVYEDSYIEIYGYGYSWHSSIENANNIHELIEEIYNDIREVL